MGDHRLPKRVVSGELENAGKRGPGGRRNNGRTAWQRIFGYCCLKKNLNAPRPSELLFLTFSELVANPEKLLYTVANPARGLLNRKGVRTPAEEVRSGRGGQG